jgi:predicted metal-binding membrane protein
MGERDPFVLNHWRDGRIGALQTGLEHGIYCLGCCWVLMLSLSGS